MFPIHPGRPTPFHPNIFIQKFLPRNPHSLLILIFFCSHKEIVERYKTKPSQIIEALRALRSVQKKMKKISILSSFPYSIWWWMVIVIKQFLFFLSLSRTSLLYFYSLPEKNETLSIAINILAVKFIHDTHAPLQIS